MTFVMLARLFNEHPDDLLKFSSSSTRRQQFFKKTSPDMSDRLHMAEQLETGVLSRAG
jgi:hypothetical protein